MGNTREDDVATRTVRLDQEAEEALREIREATGLPISEALKQGLRAMRERVSQEAARTPYDIYQELDLGPGG
ncbi:MAG: ribbon-helix-helix protein, CopG family [Luteitalea sp.]|nr:ribbon-helix-helix protein, CopG family [Luteitalea sp.]